MAIKMYIKRGKTKYQIPVLPESFALSYAQDIQVYNIVSKGEMAIPGGRKLVTFGFSSFLPRQNVNTGYTRSGKWIDPAKFCKQIKTWMTSKEFVRVIVTGSKSNINKLFYIDTFEYGVNDGTGDIEYSISFTEYRELAVKVTKNGITTLKGTGTIVSIPSTYTVKKGDTIKSIAKKYYGSSSTANVNKLAKLNNLKSPYKLTVGKKLKLK